MYSVLTPILYRCYNSSLNSYQSCNSTWSDWARWLVLALVIIFFFIFIFMCSCVSARRRRRAGQNPYYGTGWANQGRFGNNQGRWGFGNHHQQQQQVYPQTENPPNTYYAYQNPAPPYSAAQPAYRGDQQSGIELSRPENAYNADQYQPPVGPPPGKH
jgi:hypothetical protein